MARVERLPERNWAYFSTQQKSLFTGFFRSIKGEIRNRRIFIVTSEGKAVEAAKNSVRRTTGSDVEARSFAEIGFLQVPVSFREIANRVADWLGQDPAGSLLAVDMSWGLQTNSAIANFEKWMVVAEDLARN